MIYICIMAKQRGQIVVDKIIDTADQLFYTQGYNNTGVNQIIEEADIAKASLYKHFESKADLMVAYLQRFHQGWFERLNQYVSQVSDPKLKLVAVLDYHKEKQEFRKYGGCPFVKANNEAGTTDPRFLREIQTAKNHLKQFIGQLVADSGHKNILSDEELTETIFLLLEGGMVAASVFKQNSDLQNAISIIHKLV